MRVPSADRYRQVAGGFELDVGELGLCLSGNLRKVSGQACSVVGTLTLKMDFCDKNSDSTYERTYENNG